VHLPGWRRVGLVLRPGGTGVLTREERPMSLIRYQGTTAVSKLHEALDITVNAVGGLPWSGSRSPSSLRISAAHSDGSVTPRASLAAPTMA
jgi:hypothetical protein